jgi:DNA-directed RNA polymerase subunit RPC12/RpoP
MKFVCDTCGEILSVEIGRNYTCPLCKSSIGISKVNGEELYSCFFPYARMWIPMVGWALVAFGIGNALFTSPLAEYGLIAVIIGCCFLIWNVENRRREKHAHYLHDLYMQKTEAAEHAQKKLENEEEAEAKKSNGNKTIVKCPECSQNLRIPSDKHIKAKCSQCNTEFEAKDGKIL